MGLFVFHGPKGGGGGVSCYGLASLIRASPSPVCLDVAP